MVEGCARANIGLHRIRRELQFQQICRDWAQMVPYPERRPGNRLDKDRRRSDRARALIQGRMGTSRTAFAAGPGGVLKRRPTARAEHANEAVAYGNLDGLTDRTLHGNSDCITHVPVLSD